MHGKAFAWHCSAAELSLIIKDVSNHLEEMSYFVTLTTYAYHYAGICIINTKK